jgi:hypothetical protein
MNEIIAKPSADMADNPSWLEGAKLMFESIKHLVTLSTSCAAASVTLLGGPFGFIHLKAFGAAAAILLGLSSASAVRSMMAWATFVAIPGRQRFGPGFYKVSSRCFIVGMLCLGIFVARNVWR